MDSRNKTNMVNKKQEKSFSIGRLDSVYSFEHTPLEELLKNINELKKEYPHYTSFTVKLERDYYGDDDFCLKLYGHRLETDEEYNQRILRENQNKINEKERELKLYKELHKKYGLK